MAAKRKLWTDESISVAIKSVVDDGMGPRQAARVYNVPVETLRRRVNGTVPLGCHPEPLGCLPEPHTVFSEEEELRVDEYIINMADMGFGLTREDVMQLAYKLLRCNILSKMDQQDDLGLRYFERGILH